MACPSKTDPFAMLGFGSKTCLLGGDKMSRKRYSPEQIIGYLREAEVLLSKGIEEAQYNLANNA